MKNVIKGFLKFVSLLKRYLYRSVIMPIKKIQFASCGKNVYVGFGCSITYSNTYIGENVSIGQNSTIISSVAKVYIGSNVMLAPNVFLISGDHRIDIVGKYMIDLKEKDKLPENDKNIVIQDDVWIGSSAIILKGVTIGKGSVIAAGSIVTKDVESYSVYAGIPAKKIRDRFSLKEIEEHESVLGISE